MAKPVAELLEQMRSNPAGVRFADACRVLTAHFGEPRQRGGSHRIWKTPWPGDPRVNLQQGETGKAKAYQVRQAVLAIDTLRGQRERTPVPEGPPPAAGERRRPRRKERRK